MKKILALLFFGLFSSAFAGGVINSPYVLNGEVLSVYWAIPFVGILLSLAAFPIFFPEYWHKNDMKVAVFWIMSFLIPLTQQHSLKFSVLIVLQTLLHHYLPFVILIMALYTITSGIKLRTNWGGSPKSNLGILAFGTLIASWIGTTGAAMLLIRPLIRANRWRKYNTHVFVFFIFLVANVGGLLTPLGDPPLFLGFLEGVSFFWTLSVLSEELTVAAIPLLVIFYLIDSWYYKKEKGKRPEPNPEEPTNFKIMGNRNFFLLIGVIVAVLVSGAWVPEAKLSLFGIPLKLQDLCRDLFLIILTITSWKITPAVIREKNEFDWHPLAEVSKLFLAIFITSIPVLAMLHAGCNGPFCDLINSVTDPTTGAPIPARYFWMTGVLSSFLDNAPTYLVFFYVAGGNATQLMTTHSPTLAAISAGAVFMGALTYIGNAPNFMVKSIVEKNKIKMPSFFGYMGWSCAILIPVFILITFVFF